MGGGRHCRCRGETCFFSVLRQPSLQIAPDGSAHSSFDGERLRQFGDLEPYRKTFPVADCGELVGFLARHARRFRAMTITKRFRVDFYGLI